MSKLLPAVLAFCATLVLSGCHGDPSTDPSNSPSTTAPATTPTSPSPSPTLVPPTLPAAARGLTVSSADAFARFYLELIYFTQRTGDGSVMQTWSDKGCISCGKLVVRYRNAYAAGGSLTGDFRSKNVRVTASTLTDSTTAELRLTATEGHQVFRASRAAKPESRPGGLVRWHMVLAASGGHWVMFEMDES